MHRLTNPTWANRTILLCTFMAFSHSGFQNDSHILMVEKNRNVCKQKSETFLNQTAFLKSTGSSGAEKPRNRDSWIAISCQHRMINVKYCPHCSPTLLMKSVVILETNWWSAPKCIQVSQSSVCLCIHFRWGSDKCTAIL